jgi:hypothetical protein
MIISIRGKELEAEIIRKIMGNIISIVGMEIKGMVMFIKVKIMAIRTVLLEIV